ncbi:MAG: sulfide/dihydroorotate dehydrogenase-like FAD/NAD-binding protein [Clostridia bacterium]
MYRIKKKKALNDTVTLMEISAPIVAKHARAGQFIILRIDEAGERIPLTIAGFNREKGTITIIFQKVGATTLRLDTLNEGDSLLDFAGPLGKASELDSLFKKRVALVAGGLGIAIAYPQAKALFDVGAILDSFVGFRSKELFILTDDLARFSNDLIITTDDGSNGNKGFVTDSLRKKLESGIIYDEVIAIGPIPMMRAVCNLTKEYGIHTVVSMNSTMIDGTGMCGCCRLTVAGKTVFACVDGPEFDGHQVDFDMAMKRGSMYRDEERASMERERHICNLTGEVR